MHSVICVDEAGDEAPSSSVDICLAVHRLAIDQIQATAACSSAAWHSASAARSIAVAHSTFIFHGVSELHATAVDWIHAPNPHRHHFRLVHIASAVLVHVPTVSVANVAHVYRSEVLTVRTPVTLRVAVVRTHKPVRTSVACAEIRRASVHSADYVTAVARQAADLDRRVAVVLAVAVRARRKRLTAVLCDRKEEAHGGVVACQRCVFDSAPTPSDGNFHRPFCVTSQRVRERCVANATAVEWIEGPTRCG